MNRVTIFLSAALCAAGCAARLGGDQGTVGTDLTASSKATAAIATVTVCANTSSAPCTSSTAQGVWQDVMAASLKTSAVSDLFVDTSLVTGLYTSTTVKGSGSGATSTASAMGGVSVRLLLDGAAGQAYPDTTGDGVTFDERIQTLTANLGNIFTNCFAMGGTTGTGCTLTQEQVTLALDTTSAHSFAFILPNVGTGSHTVKVQAQVNTSANGSGGGVAVANALYGLGSLTIDSVQLVNSFSF